MDHLFLTMEEKQRSLSNEQRWIVHRLSAKNIRHGTNPSKEALMWYSCREFNCDIFINGRLAIQKRIYHNPVRPVHWVSEWFEYLFIKRFQRPPDRMSGMIPINSIGVEWIGSCLKASNSKLIGRITRYASYYEENITKKIYKLLERVFSRYLNYIIEFRKASHM